MSPRCARSRAARPPTHQVVVEGFRDGSGGSGAAPGRLATGFISPDLTSNGIHKSGYIFLLARNNNPDTTDVLTPTCNAAVGLRASSFFASAFPVTPGSTGIKHFTTDTPGTIYMDDTAAIPNPIPVGTRTTQQ